MCYPNKDELLAAATKLAPPHFHTGEPRKVHASLYAFPVCTHLDTSESVVARLSAGVQYAMDAKVRNFNAMTRLDCIKAVGPALGAGHTVDLSNPDVFIYVEVAMVSGSRFVFVGSVCWR